MNQESDINFFIEKANQQSSKCLTLPATVTIKRILSLTSKSSHAYYELATLSFHQKNYPKAERLYKRAATIDPYSSNSYFNWGACLAKQRKFDQASILFQKTLDLDPDDIVTRCVLGHAYYDQGLDKEALKEFEKVLEIDPDYFSAYVKYGNIFFEIGEEAKGIEQIRKALELETHDSSANNAMGIMLLVQGRYQEAIKCFLIMVDHSKQIAFGWMNCSLVVWQQGKKEQAMGLFEQGLSAMKKGNERHGIIENYKFSLASFERKARQANGKGENSDTEKTIESIKWILDLLQNRKDEF